MFCIQKQFNSELPENFLFFWRKMRGEEKHYDFIDFSAREMGELRVHNSMRAEFSPTRKMMNQFSKKEMNCRVCHFFLQICNRILHSNTVNVRTFWKYIWNQSSANFCTSQMLVLHHSLYHARYIAKCKPTIDIFR